MRGKAPVQPSLIVLMNPEDLVPRDHPLRRIKKLADAVLREQAATFEQMYAATGRPSIPPERLLKSTILMALYTVRSERMFCEQLSYNLLFRWFLDMDMTEKPFDASVFAKNRERLLAHHVADEFFYRVVDLARGGKLLSAEHFTVDGTLIESWASIKSFRKKGETKGPDDDDRGNPSVDFHGEKRTNQTHESTTDPEARLMRKGQGKEAKLSFSLHALSENRHGIVVDIRVDEANGTAERRQATEMLDAVNPGGRRITLGADKGYDTKDFVRDCRERKVTPHIARNVNRNGGSALDCRTIRHPGYRVSQRKRKRIEEVFGWIKTVGGYRKTRYIGIDRNQLWAYITGAAYNLVRMAKLMPAQA
jgi:transposase